jgi:hypothetical protein
MEKEEERGERGKREEGRKVRSTTCLSSSLDISFVFACFYTLAQVYSNIITVYTSMQKK